MGLAFFPQRLYAAGKCLADGDAAADEYELYDGYGPRVGWSFETGLALLH